MLNSFRLFLLLLAVAAAASLSSKPAVATMKGCLLYEPGSVTLKGQLHHGGSTWTLELPKPICIEGRENDKMGYYPTMDEVKTIIFWTRKSDSPDTYKEFADKEVVVTGTLHHKSATSGYGETEMMVAQIDIAKP